MICQYEKIGSNKAKLTFTASAEEFKDALQKAYQKMKGQIFVPGFRKGKAPRRMMESMYGKGLFYEDAMDFLFPDAYKAAIKDNELKPVDRPAMDKIDQMEEGKDLIFSCTVFVEPDVTLGDYAGMSLKRFIKKVTDEDVDARLEQERNKVARSTDVTGRALEDGDIANLDYAGTVDGVAFEGGTAEDQTLEIGSGKFIPGFESQMIGMNIGEEKDITVTFPEDYHEESLKGKEAVFHVKLNGITKEELPALDDDFASEVSEFNTLAEFREHLFKTMQEQNDEESDASLKNRIIRELTKLAEIDVPTAMVEDRLDDILQEISWNMQRQGYSLEQLMKMTGQNIDFFRDMYRPQALQAVREALVLAAVAKAEGIEAAEEDVDALLSEYATNMHETLESLKSTISEAALDSVKKDVVAKKVLEFLKEKIHIIDTEDPEEDEESEEHGDDCDCEECRAKSEAEAEQPEAEAEAEQPEA